MAAIGDGCGDDGGGDDGGDDDGGDSECPRSLCCKPRNEPSNYSIHSRAQGRKF